MPDRIVLSPTRLLRTIEPAARTTARLRPTAPAQPQVVPARLVNEPCLEPAQAVSSAACCASRGACRQCRSRSNGRWTTSGFKLLQARPLHVEPAHVPDEIWLQHPGLNGHPAGIGWGSGRAVVINCECEIARVAPGDVLITQGGGSRAQPHPAARGRRRRRARRPHLAHGVARARARHPDGARRARRHPAHPRRRAGRGRRRRRHRALDALSAPRIFVTQPIADERAEASARARRASGNPDGSQIIPQEDAVAAVKKADILFSPAARQDRPRRGRRPIRSCARSRRSRSRPTTSTSPRRPRAAFRSPWCRRSSAEATADINFGLMLAVARRMVEGDRMVRAGKFPGAQSSHLARRVCVRQDARPRRRRRPHRQGGGAPRPRLRHAGALLGAAPQAGGARSRSSARPMSPLDAAAARVGFRLAAFAAQRGDAPSDRRARARR